MTQDRLRELIKEYLEVTPVGLVGLAKELNVSFVTLKRFINGEVASVKVWKKIDDFVKSRCC